MDSSKTLKIPVTASFSLFPSPNVLSLHGFGREPQREHGVWTIKGLQMALKFEVNPASVWLHGSSWQSPEHAGLALPRLRIQLSLPNGLQAFDPILGGIKHLKGGKVGEGSPRGAGGEGGGGGQPPCRACSTTPCECRAESGGSVPSATSEWYPHPTGSG